ncbi:hypothetical protein [Moorena producens]|uniref:hypothetical protein n=1 Tax=Moorena producens TaxID=1155739 RepID=UPI003C71DB6A
MVSPTRALHQDGSREKGTKILTIPTGIGIGKLSAISYQLSAISYQLSAISYQPSAISP